MFVFLFLSCQVLSTKVFLPQSNPGQGQEQTQETEDKKEREGEGNKKKKVQEKFCGKRDEIMSRTTQG